LGEREGKAIRINCKKKIIIRKGLRRTKDNWWNWKEKKARIGSNFWNNKKKVNRQLRNIYKCIKKSINTWKSNWKRF
jgi:hypothetical protein